MNSIVKYQAAIALLVTILSNFSDCNYCPASAPTVSVVSKCPTNKTEWDQAASRKKCNLMSAKCGDKTPVYHCLLNQWRNETVEVCASTWYISGFCAVYNTDEMKVIDDFERDCTKFSEGKCLTRYISSEAYLYQKCYMQKSSNRSIRTEETEETNDCILSTIIAIVVTVLVLVITSLVVFITLRLKISKKAQDEECMLFCNATTQIRDKNERENLLEKNDKENAEPKGVFKKEVKPKVEHTRKNYIEFSSCKKLNNEENTDIDPAAEKENAVQKVNEEIRVNQTKKTAKSSSCGDPVELKQKPDTVETCGVDRSKPPVVSELLAKYADKENAEPKGVFKKDPAAEKENAVQKDVKQKADQTIRSRRNFINEEENVEEREKLLESTPSEMGIKAQSTKAKDPAAEKGNAVQKDVKQKADQTIRPHRNFINEEENVEEREKLSVSTPSEMGVKTQSTKAKDLAADMENAAENEDDQNVNHTTKNDVEFSPHENPTNEENEDVNTQSLDSTKAKSTEDDQKVDHTIKNYVDFSSHENPTNEENEDVNTQSPDSTLKESVKNTTKAKSTEFKHDSDDTNDGGVSSDGTVRKQKQYFERLGGTVEGH